MSDTFASAPLGDDPEPDPAPDPAVETEEAVADEAVAVETVEATADDLARPN